MAGPDLGRCFAVNLRTGMYLAWLLQAAMIGFFSFKTIDFFMNPTMNTYFFFKGVVLNTGSVIYLGTGAATVLVGAFAVFFRPEGSPQQRRSAYQCARLWMWLSIAMVPAQFAYGGYLSFKCAWMMRKLTPSLIITDAAFQYAFHGEKGGAKMMMNMLNPGAPDDTKKKNEFKGAVDKLDEPEKFAPEVEKETESKLGGVGKAAAKWISKWKKPVGLFVVVLTALILSAVFHETQWVKSMLPHPMNELYGMGLNFIVTFLFYAWLPGLLHIAIAIHIAAYQAVLERGGVGDEFVGWKRLRWFYNLSSERRREIRAGAKPEELRRRVLDNEYPDSEDSTSGSEFEEVIDEDKRSTTAVVERIQRSHR